MQVTAAAVTPVGRRRELTFRRLVHAVPDGELGRRFQHVQHVSAPKSTRALTPVHVFRRRPKAAAARHLRVQIVVYAGRVAKGVSRGVRDDERPSIASAAGL